MKKQTKNQKNAESNLVLPKPKKRKPTSKLKAILQKHADAFGRLNIKTIEDLNKALRGRVLIEKIPQSELEIITAFNSFAKLFSTDIADALVDADLVDRQALLEIEEKNFVEHLRSENLSDSSIEFERQRFIRLKELAKKEIPIDQINALIIDLPENVSIGDADRNKLNKYGIESLSDWAELREKMDISKRSKKILDQYTRLHSLKIDAKLAEKLINKRVDSATVLSRQSTKEIKKLSKETGIKPEKLLQMQSRAQSAARGAASAFDQGLVNGNLPVGLDDILKPIKRICIPCTSSESVFSKFAYFIYLVQTTGEPISQLSDKLAMGVDLKNLSPAAEEQMQEDPLATCTQISLLDLVIRRLQEHLDKKQRAASSAEIRRAFEYLNYVSWRVERQGHYYPELAALWRDDVFTYEQANYADRGSLFTDHENSHNHLTHQIELLKELLETVRINNGNNSGDTFLEHPERMEDENRTQKFSDLPEFESFKRGLELLTGVIEANHLVYQASDDIANVSSAAALGKLQEAATLLQNVSNLAFQPSSNWLQYKYRDTSYSTLWDIPAANLKDELAALFDELMGGTKKIFITDSGDLQEAIDENVNAGPLLSRNVWDLQGQFELGQESQEGNTPGNFGKIIKLDDTHPHNVYFHCRYVGAEEITDIDFTAEVKQLRDIGSWPVGELVGIGTRLSDNGSDGYFLVMEKEIFTTPVDDAGDTAVGQDQHFILYKRSNNVFEEVARDQRGTLQEDFTFRLRVSTNNNGRVTIRGNATSVNGIVNRELEYSTDSPVRAKGTFGLVVSGSLKAVFGPLSVTVNAIDPASKPVPFFAENRSQKGHQLLVGNGIHRERTRGIGRYTAGTSFVKKTNDPRIEKLNGITSGRQRYLLIPEGGLRPNLNTLDTIFDLCLGGLFCLRFAVIPVRMAQAYALSGNYDAALSMICIVYDDEALDDAVRPIYPQFVNASSVDELNRPISPDIRLIKIRIAEICMAYAEWMFRKDTAQSRYQAQKLYNRILRLYDNENCECESLLGQITEEILDRVLSIIDQPTEPENLDSRNFLDLMSSLYGKPEIAAEVVEEVFGSNDAQDDVADATELVSADMIYSKISEAFSSWSRQSDNQMRYNTVLDRGTRVLEEMELNRIRFNPLISFTGDTNPTLIAGWLDTTFQFAPLCVPPNPLRLQHIKQACLMLSLLKSCRNILGYSERFLPQLRFDFLKHLSNEFTVKAIAAERDLLNFRERFETESFSIIQAEQNLAMSKSDIELEKLSVDLARGDILGAAMQLAQVNSSVSHYEKLINDGLSGWEELGLAASWTATGATGVAAIGGILSMIAAVGGAATAPTNPASPVISAIGLAGTVLGGASGIASFASSLSSSANLQASYERREQEWKYNRDQSQFSSLLSENNLMQSNQRHSIAQQRLAIANLKHDFAEDALNFLNNKVLNRAMYAWMLKTIREQYRVRLNYAIDAAFMAERALEFEIQNKSIDTIRFDYFDPSKDGLLGATQLQTDISTLEHTHLRLSKRKLQLSKTISLSEHFPEAFAAFRQSGVLPFSTASGSWVDPDDRSAKDYSLELFDRDFPGHYMRLIKTIKVSVIALVPPVDGIKASLRNSGISSVVLGPPYADDYKEITIERQPDSIALSAPFNSTGVFMLDYNDKFLLPFEGNGVATDWVFKLPKPANNFDFDTIFDVLITIDYTALESDDSTDSSGTTFRQKVIDRLGNDVVADRSYSLKYNYADAWYHLNNPENPLPQLEPMEVEISVKQEDFPTNQSQLRIKRVTLLAVQEDGNVEEINIALKFLPENSNSFLDGGIIKTKQGLISKQNGNADNWDIFVDKAPFGKWRLKLRDENDITSFTFVKQLLIGDKIKDILLVITYSGKLTNWND